jgi:hypothetical protein
MRSRASARVSPPPYPISVPCQSTAVAVNPRSPLRDQPEILVIEVEHPVQLGPRRRACVAAEHGRLFISQELHRHDRNIAPTSW